MSKLLKVKAGPTSGVASNPLVTLAIARGVTFHGQRRSQNEAEEARMRMRPKTC